MLYNISADKHFYKFHILWALKKPVHQPPLNHKNKCLNTVYHFEYILFHFLLTKS